MSFYPEPDFSHVHPPAVFELWEAKRYLSVYDEITLVSLLHAIIHTHEDIRFDWPKVSRGDFRLSFKDAEEEVFKDIVYVKFSGKTPENPNFRTEKMSLDTDYDDKFNIEINILPPEARFPSDPNWHALCLAKSLEHELAFATLCFLEWECPNNQKLLRYISCEKNRIYNTYDHEYPSLRVWKSHLEELERCIKDTFHGGVYAPIKAMWGVGRIPQYTRDYEGWFYRSEEKAE
jgi:hypothetical protein